MSDFAHYLEAKRTVDDRSLHGRVIERLRDELARVASPAVVDIGAGIGTGIERLLDWGVVRDPVYTGVDRDADLIEVAKKRSNLAQAQFIVSTLEQFASDPWNLGRFDVVIAHAFLDIVDLGASLASLLALARRGGLLYFPITFDGETIFEPAHDDDLAILSRYHAAMCETGNPRTGRRLYHALRRQPAEILAMGSSDWIVYPEGRIYPADEAFFLQYIIGTIARTVGADAENWAAARYRQIEEAELIYIAHQIDCLARKQGQVGRRQRGNASRHARKPT